MGQPQPHPLIRWFAGHSGHNSNWSLVLYIYIYMVSSKIHPLELTLNELGEPLLEKTTTLKCEVALFFTLVVHTPGLPTKHPLDNIHISHSIWTTFSHSRPNRVTPLLGSVLSVGARSDFAAGLRGREELNLEVSGTRAEGLHTTLSWRPANRRC